MISLAYLMQGNLEETPRSQQLELLPATAVMVSDAPV